ncbi:hypothetical protein NOJ05_19565 [Neorhizobium galegae]|uniref:hypothetical protein n=1 Tax=Neorhizobium galegae TaxID=399 RepID=UPI00210525FB|nr:hypothetical protein [Neorhizobium galegae]MCQ1779410.1 hypothetical protein [Neorhizobium galegae]MCQ1795570.1 hypothetical protein [Neorhizobium galegae]
MTAEMLPAETVRDEAGQVLLYSWHDFVETICQGNCCFVCGASPREKKFNDEHIVPNWVLHRFDLHSKNLTLPNGNEHKYGTYTVPCCVECNTTMAETFETPMSRLFDAGAGAIQDFVAEKGPLIPFTWMALIFLKMHLKDGRMRRHLDRRKGDELISEDYVWEHMHHLHAVARAFTVKAEVEAKAFGSMFVFPIRGDGTTDAFDLATFTEAQTLYIRLGSTGIVAVFDDACAAIHGIYPLLEKLDGPLSWTQAREVAARMALANLDLENRPSFWTHISSDKEKVIIGGTTDTAPRFRKLNAELYGQTMAGVFRDLPPVDGYTPEQAMSALQAGSITFLFDDHGNFIHDHAPKPPVGVKA